MRMDKSWEEMEILVFIFSHLRGCHHERTGKNVELDGVRGQWVNHSQKTMAKDLKQMGFLKEGRK